VIFGPPAVGKMTVGREVAARSGFRLLHNHATIEPLIQVFDWDSAAFATLNREFRRRIFEEAAAAGVDLIFSAVWNVDDPADLDYVRELIAPYDGWPIAFVELTADLPTRLDRNRTERRLMEKASKRNLEWSETNLRELEQHRMNTDAALPSVADELLSRYSHLRLDNTDLPPEQAAELILAWLDRA